MVNTRVPYASVGSPDTRSPAGRSKYQPELLIQSTASELMLRTPPAATVSVFCVKLRCAAALTSGVGGAVVDHRVDRLHRSAGDVGVAEQPAGTDQDHAFVLDHGSARAPK